MRPGFIDPRDTAGQSLIRMGHKFGVKFIQDCVVVDFDAAPVTRNMIEVNKWCRHHFNTDIE